VKRTLCIVFGTSLLLAASSQARSPHHATLETFAGRWSGHTRVLAIRRNGHAAESIYSGCCDPVLNLDFHLSRPQGTASDATAVATVTAVWVRDRSAFSEKDPAPRVGERRVIRLRNHVLTETLTGIDYCGPGAGAFKCGA
jgi:hypothetical protein